jgi:hypothetical protein
MCWWDVQVQANEKRLASSAGKLQQQLFSESKHQLLQPMSGTPSAPHSIKPAPSRRSSFPSAQPSKTSTCKPQTGVMGSAHGGAAATSRIPQPPPARDSPARDSPARLHKLKQLQYLPDRIAASDSHPDCRHTTSFHTTKSCPDLSIKITDQQLLCKDDASSNQKQQSAHRWQQDINASGIDRGDDDDLDGCHADLSHLLAAQAIVVQLLSPVTASDMTWHQPSAVLAANMAPAALKASENAPNSSSKAASQIGSLHVSSWQERHRHASTVAMARAQASNKVGQLVQPVSWPS